MFKLEANAVGGKKALRCGLVLIGHRIISATWSDIHDHWPQRPDKDIRPICNFFAGLEYIAFSMNPSWLQLPNLFGSLAVSESICMIAHC